MNIFIPIWALWVGGIIGGVLIAGLIGLVIIANSMTNLVGNMVIGRR